MLLWLCIYSLFISASNSQQWIALGITGATRHFKLRRQFMQATPTGYNPDDDDRWRLGALCYNMNEFQNSNNQPMSVDVDEIV